MNRRVQYKKLKEILSGTGPAGYFITYKFRKPGDKKYCKNISN